MSTKMPEKPVNSTKKVSLLIKLSRVRVPGGSRLKNTAEFVDFTRNSAFSYV